MEAGNRNRPDPERVRYERKPVSLITTTAGMAATVTAMLIGSLFGAKATLWGAALGSGISAVAGTVFENAFRKTRAYTSASQGGQKALRYGKMGGIMAAACLVAALLTMTMIEKATGRTLHSLTTGHRQFGTSFSYSTETPPAPSVTPSVTITVTPSSSSPSPVITPDPSPDAIPDATPGIISGSGSPSITESPSISPSTGSVTP